MSSPSRLRVTFSPIRNLQQKYSPSRNLDVILEESVSSKKSVRQSAGQNQNVRYQSKYSLPSPTYSAPNVDTRRILVQNDRLKNDNQILASSRNYASMTYGKELDLKEREVQSLRRQLGLLQDRYERQNQTLRYENDSLRKNLVLMQNQKSQEIQIIRHRYLTMPEQQRQSIRKEYTNDITKALMDLETAHILLGQKQKQLQHFSFLCKQNSHEYGFNLEQLISQNNILKNKLLQFQHSAQKEMRQMTAKKQLQKSRTQGIISYCKQNTLYIQKQINRLAEQLLKKNISIESFNRQITKHQKLIQQQGRRHDDQVHRMKRQHEQVLSDKENSFSRLEKQFKVDLAQKKRVQFQLIEKISTIENQVQSLQKMLDFALQTVSDRQREIAELKESIERKQQDHARQISKVMSDSRVKRKSTKNLSFNSFKDIEQGQGSSIIKSGHLKRKQSILDEGQGEPLPTVHQEQILARSQGFGVGQQQQQFQLKELIIHYESLIEQIRRNKLTELSIANNKIQSMKQSLNQKQQEILDILNRFSPLMEYKMNREDIDEQRKRRIQEHQKGDIDILSVMLHKYDIVALRRK